MRAFTLLALCMSVTIMTASTAEARPGYLGPYRPCGYTYVEAAKKCAGAFVIDIRGTYRIQVEPYGSDSWIDASPALNVRKVIRRSDWNWIYYKIRNG